MSLLVLDGVRVQFELAGGALHALDGVSFALAEGEALGLVGESGCGKTTVARTILRLLPPNGTVTGGRIRFQGRELLTLAPDAMREVRWRGIALVTQSAMNGLDPVYRVGAQLVEAIRAHEPIGRRAAWERAERLFELVGLRPEWTRRYPHELSGGMRQRAIIAMALALDPPLIIADEPTTALDVIMQEQVFAELARLRAGRRAALLLVTHDISLVAENCDRVAVMYAGQVVELAPTASLFAAPAHPYTIGLQNAFAAIEGEARPLISIAGAPPDLTAPPAGCRFSPRCPFARERCRTTVPAVQALAPDHVVACHFPEEAERFRAEGRLEATWERVGA